MNTNRIKIPVNLNALAGIILITALILAFMRIYKEQGINSRESAYPEEKGSASIFEQPHDNPGKFKEYFRTILARRGESSSGYTAGYRVREFYKALRNSRMESARTAAYTWTERGPSNVPGRTRGIVILPGDPENNIWLAGAVGGGIWKTADGGTTWINKTPDLPNLSTTTLAFSASNPNIIYAGTGESFGAGGLIEITGQGIYKSLDQGETWDLIPSTVDIFNFLAVNRIIVDPSDPDILLISVNQNTERGIGFSSGIFKSIDGGQNWYQVYQPNGWVQQILFEPGNFNIQYAAEYATGVAKSTDAGETWQVISNGIYPTGRLELAISPLNTQRLFAAAEGELSGVNSDFYISEDGGLNWQLVIEINNAVNRNFFAASASSDPQGGWNNTVAVNPFNDDIVYVGGVDLWKMGINPGAVIGERAFAGVVREGTGEFMDFVNFTNAEYWGSRLAVGDIDTARFVSVEIRFGPGISQKAHRFETPSDGGTAGDGGAGIPDSLYQYIEYVDIPIQAWDIKNNRQLMVSFRDQAKNGEFDLIEQNTEGPFALQSREYFYIHDVDYNPVNPSILITKNGGQAEEMMYFMWPVLAPGTVWDAANLPQSKVTINWENLVKRLRETTRMTSWMENDTEDGRALPYVHADQHNIIPVVMNSQASEFKIVNSNDGGVFQSVTGTDPGLSGTDWIFAGNGFNTSQFYGVDKKPGADEFIGGLQDNGTFMSPRDTAAVATTKYNRAGGGDGFEAVWNYTNSQEIIISVYNNYFSKSKDGGNTWISATQGLTDIGNLGPFISRLANTKSNPEVLFTVGSSGVWKSEDFGDSWKSIPIGSGWVFSITMNIRISLSNPNILWAGSEMSQDGDIFMSVNGGESFQAVNDYQDVAMGPISGMATHPIEDSTAYLLFSFAGSPKILRTRDLGESWEDISGFGTQGVSSNGFPDVAVHSLLALPQSPGVIWAGTEIGIFESPDNGQTWSLMNAGFPSVSVWDMKAVDDRIVVATHGRGIWTAAVPELPGIVILPLVKSVGVSPAGDLAILAGLRSDYDSTIITVNNVTVKKLLNTTEGDSVVNISYSGEEGNVKVLLKSFRNGKSYISLPGSGLYFIPNAVADLYVTDFSDELVQNDFTGNGFTIKTIVGFSPAIHSQHFYAQDTNFHYYLKNPIAVSEEIPTVIFDDIAIVEPGESGSVFGDEGFYDYVVTEGSSDGATWFPLSPGYDARFDGNWLIAYNNIKNGTSSMFRRQTFNLLDYFTPGEIIFIRFRLFSDPLKTAWGWAIDNLYIQEDRPLGFGDSPNIINTVIYPNPFSQYFHLEFNLLKDGYTQVEILDMRGASVASFPMGYLMRGKHFLDVDASTFPEGFYIARISGSGRFTALKLIKN